MRILIDAHMVGERETGNETYITGLLAGLTRVCKDDEIFVAASHPDAVTAAVDGARGLTIVPVTAGPIRRLAGELPRLVSRIKPDVLCATYAGPVVLSCPMALAVHDVSFRRHPEWFSPRDRLVLNLGVGVSIRRARAVLTLSEFSRREIVGFYPVAKDRTFVTPLAQAARFGPAGSNGNGNDEDVLRRYGIKRPYVLAVGDLQPRKNLPTLIEAFARLAAGGDFVHDLVLIGKAKWQGSAVGAAIDRLGVSARVKLAGYVPGEDLPAMYRAAEVFVYPSLYEGFGLPVLEAMACGTPVVASNLASIPEVAGDAARLVDPRSVDALATAIGDLCRDSSQRNLHRERGLRHSRAFSWDRTAQQTLDVFRRVTA